MTVDDPRHDTIVNATCNTCSAELKLAAENKMQAKSGWHPAAPSALAKSLAAYASSDTSSNSSSDDGGEALQQQQSTQRQAEKRKTSNGTPAPRKRVRFADDYRSHDQGGNGNGDILGGKEEMVDGATEGKSASIDGLDRPRRHAEAVYIPQPELVDKSLQKEESEVDWSHLEDEREAHVQRELQARVARLRKRITDARKTRKTKESR